MSANVAGAKGRWAWAAAGTVMVSVVLLGLFSALRPPAVVPLAASVKPAIEVAERREKSALDDQATLLDPTPLFQPTRWNTARMEVAPPEPGGTFQGYRVPAKLGFADSDLRLGKGDPSDLNGRSIERNHLRFSLELPVPIVVPAKPADALETRLSASLTMGFGRSDLPVGSLPTYGAQVEIVSMNSDQPPLAPRAIAEIRALAAAAQPPRGKAWGAMEFVAAVDPAGLVAPVAITKRSGFEDVDSYFQNFIATTLRIGDRLTPGFYRISVGP